jgi:hypothetical protein
MFKKILSNGYRSNNHCIYSHSAGVREKEEINKRQEM